MTSKTPFILAGISLAALALFLVTAPTSLRSPTNAPRPAAPDTKLTAGDESKGDLRTRVSRDETEDTVTDRVVAGPRVRVIDDAGAPLPSALVGWVDQQAWVRLLTLDDDGWVERPAGDGYVMASALDLISVDRRVHASEEEVLLTLRTPSIVHVVLTENGRVPEEPLRLRFIRPRPSWLVTGHLTVELEELGFFSGWVEVETGRDGTVEIPLAGGAEVEHWVLPSSHRLLTVNNRPCDADRREVLRLSPGMMRVEADLARLPAVTGRLIDAADGQQLEASLWVILEGSRVSGLMHYVRTDRTGRFAIGLPVEEAALDAPYQKRQEGLLHAALRLGLDDPRALFERRIELAGVALPLDLGDVLVSRAPSPRFRVLGPDGPLEGAGVASSLGRGRTNAEGIVTLPVDPDGQLEVLAHGHAYRRLDLTPMNLSSPEPIEVHLEPASLLEVYGAAWPATHLDCRTRVQLAWKSTPFMSAYAGGRQPNSYAVHRALHGHALDGGGYNQATPGLPGHCEYVPPREGALRIAGLSPGSSFQVGVVDVLDQLLAEQVVTVPLAPRPVAVDLSGSRDSATLRVELHWADGRGVSEALIFVEGSAHRGHSFALEGDTLELGPLAPGSYRIRTQVRGSLPVEVDDYVLAPGGTPLDLELVPSRTLALHIRDETGQRMRPRTVNLHGPGGWHEAQQNPDAGLVRFPAVPRAELMAVFRLGTRVYELPIEATGEQAELVLPAHGTVHLRVPKPPKTSSALGTLVLRLIDEHGQGKERLAFRPESAGPLEITAQALPGEYRLEVDIVEEAASRTIHSRTVLIRPGDTTRIDLER